MQQLHSYSHCTSCTTSNINLVGVDASSSGSERGLLDVTRGVTSDRLESGPQETVVHDLGTLSRGEHEPDDSKGLESVVEGEPVEDNVDEALDEGEESEHHPVSQPLHVVLGLRSLKRDEREVGRDEEAKHVGEEAGEAD